MDKVGLRELLSSGLQLAQEAWRSLGEDDPEPTGDTPSFDGVLDRLVDVGVIAAEHDSEWLWSELIQTLLRVFCLGVPKDAAGWPREEEAFWMARVAQRVLVLGATAIRFRKHHLIRPLVLQLPVERRAKRFWLRYAVTMASRGEVAEVFKGKSLIGPASETVRGNATVWSIFDENMDVVVNHMCQFDYLACLIAVLETDELSSCYPNFGGYFSHRTIPVVREIVKGGPARLPLLDVPEEKLANVMIELSKLAHELFFFIAAWDGYEDSEVQRFLAEHTAS